ncbi:chromatin structure-remodeling complex subunit RSC7 [Cryptotrichosporon argae]
MPPKRRAAASAAETPRARRSKQESAEAGPSRRRRGQTDDDNDDVKQEADDDDDGDAEGDTEEDAEGEDEDEQPARKRRATRAVSYKEVAPEEGEEEGDDDGEETDEKDDDEDGDKDNEPAARSRRTSRSAAAETPRRRGRPSLALRASAQKEKNREGDADGDGDGDDPKDKPYKREPGTGGRGGFSVKGAAAAAARARWDKVRRERAERGNDDDDAAPRSARKTALKRRDKEAAAAESAEVGSTVTIRGVEYTVGEDELVLPEDAKGNTKIDADGHLLGGREYKFTAFTSPSRANSRRLYALTIDAARACGYTDSLAFLRRCPQIIKLPCNGAEREMLIECGRIQGNLKHRIITMVALRNVYKLMGARLVKGGKWVTDDYNEEQALIECANNGWTPGVEVVDEDLSTVAAGHGSGPGRPAAGASDLTHNLKATLASWYQPGGPTTHFGASGTQPWTEPGWGHKRARLRGMGVTEENWLLKLSEDARALDDTLKAYRAGGARTLDGRDAEAWVWAQEEKAAAKPEPAYKADANGHLGAPRKVSATSALAHHVDVTADADVPAAPQDVDMAEPAAGTPRLSAPEIVVQTDAETARHVSVRWTAGVVRAVYEPHTHTPLVPRHTQPHVSSTAKLVPRPLLPLPATVNPLGLATVEYVFEPTAADAWAGALANGAPAGEIDVMRRAVDEAEAWERRARARASH